MSELRVLFADRNLGDKRRGGPRTTRPATSEISRPDDDRHRPEGVRWDAGEGHCGTPMLPSFAVFLLVLTAVRGHSPVFSLAAAGDGSGWFVLCCAGLCLIVYCALCIVYCIPLGGDVCGRVGYGC